MSSEKKSALPKKPWVLFRHPYADFPGYKSGDICHEPSEEMLRVAATSSCMTILEDPVGAEGVPPTADSPCP